MLDLACIVRACSGGKIGDPVSVAREQRLFESCFTEPVAAELAKGFEEPEPVARVSLSLQDRLLDEGPDELGDVRRPSSPSPAQTACAASSSNPPANTESRAHSHRSGSLRSW